MSTIDLASDSAAAEHADALKREAVISLTVRAARPGQIGPYLDELMPMFGSFCDLLCDGGLDAELEVPGYSQVFYGYERTADVDGT